MERELLLSAAVVTGVLFVASTVFSDDERGSDDLGPIMRGAPHRQPERCPTPRITDLRVRPLSEDGERIALSVRAAMERRGIGAFEVSWGKRSALIADGWWGRRAAASFEHRYPGPGTYRVRVVAEGSTRGCTRAQKSEPATLRIRIPLRPTSPSSP